jgi:hypothetical protein
VRRIVSISCSRAAWYIVTTPSRQSATRGAASMRTTCAHSEWLCFIFSMLILLAHLTFGVQCLGAASALREQMGTPLRSADQAAVEQVLATAHMALGADAFTAMWAQVREVRLDQLLNNTIPSAAVSGVLPD